MNDRISNYLKEQITFFKFELNTILYFGNVISFLKVKKPKRVRYESVLGFFFVRLHSKLAEHFQNCRNCTDINENIKFPNTLLVNCSTSY